MRLLTQTFVGMTLLCAPATPATAADWVDKQVPEFGYSAVFPEAPEADSTIENGVKLNSQVAGGPDGLCLVTVGDYPGAVDPDLELAASRDNFAKGVKGAVSNSKRIGFARGFTALPAMEFDATNDTHIFRSIIVIDGQRVYQVAGGVPKGAANSSDIDRCVRGLRLIAG